MTAWLIRAEPWLPAAAALIWWTACYPGFIGDDSLIHLDDARRGHVPVWFTAWWIYVVRFATIGTRVIPLLTLIGALTLSYAAYFWIRTAFNRGGTRAITVLAITICPLVGAMGVQVRHDVPMTAALLLCAAVLSRTWTTPRFTPVEVVLLIVAAVLLPTRHNGVPTIAATGIVLLLSRRQRWRQAVAMLSVAAAAWAITLLATRASGNTHSVQPAQTVEWLMGDISCALSKAGVTATPQEWLVLERIADRADWPQPAACIAMNPVLRARSFNATQLETHIGELVGVWQSLAMRHSFAMITAHGSRVRLHLPPPLGGGPQVVNFLHSTILPNNFGLEWTFPRVAELARLVVRAWNALGYVLANSALWLIVLMVLAWRSPARRPMLVPSIIIGTVLNVGLIAAAPISEGRYGLFILITGQAAALCAALTPRSAALPAVPRAAPIDP